MDHGQRVVQEVYDRLQIDGKWSVRGERGFTWWAGDLRQSVWAETPFQDLEMEIVRVHARTDLIKGYRGDERQKQGLGALMPFCTLSGYVPDRRDPSRIQLASSVYVNESTVDWMGEFFTWATMIQNIEAHILVRSLPELVGADADASGHPESGARADMDEMSELLTHVVAPEGREPSRYAGPEMAELVENIQHPPTVMATGDADGLTSELPFVGRTSMVRLFTDAQNPRMGNGLLATCSLPVEIGDPVGRALQMNSREVSEPTRAHFLGSWCLAPTGSFSFVSFYPNAMFKQNMLLNVYMTSLLRCRWAAERVYGDDWENGGFDRALGGKMERLRRLTGEMDSEKKKSNPLGRFFGRSERR